MKVKIIKNAPEDNNCSDISKYIGQEFEVESPIDGVITVFKGEYEILNEDRKSENIKEDSKEDKGCQAFSNLIDMVFEIADELNDKVINHEGLTDIEFNFLDAFDEYIISMTDEDEFEE